MSAARPPRPTLAGALTPLVDTLFLLLFSLLALSDTRAAHATELVRVELPRVEPGDDAPAAAARLVLEIGRDSSVRLRDGGPVLSRDELDRALAERLGDALPEEVEVVIHADRDARHGVAVELLEHLRRRGFVRVGLVALGERGRSGPFGSPGPSPDAGGRGRSEGGAGGG